MHRSGAYARRLALLAALGAPLPAHAQPNAVAAQALYDAATKAMDAKDFASACPKLEDVVKLLPEGVGARLTLADCYIGAGKLASAWSAYLGAESTAARLGQAARAAQAHASAEALRPRLATIVITVPDAVKRVPSLSIRQDGIALGETSWGIPIPVDRGRHTVEATAVGKQPLTKYVEVTTDGAKVVVSVDALEDAAVAPVPPVALAPVVVPPAVLVPPSSSPSPTRPTQPSADTAILPPPAPARVSPLVYAGFGIGGAGILVGAITGGVTLAKASSCRPAMSCTASEISAARTTAWVSDIAFGVGGAGVVLGILGLTVAKPRSPSPASALAPSLVVGPRSVGLAGIF